MKKAIILGAILALLGAFVPGAHAEEGPNLIQNPSFEIVSPTNSALPDKWSKGGYGVNQRVLTYPAIPAFDGGRAAKAEITSYTSGDAKWVFSEISVSPGATYRFSTYYHSNIPSFITVQYRLNDGTFLYKDIATPEPSSGYRNVQVTFVVPANASALTIFHLIKQVGVLTIDNVELHQVISSPPPPPPPPSNGNLIFNPSLETANPSNSALPDRWSRGGYGTNDRSFTYPVSGFDGARAAKVQIMSYTSGDAKWYFQDVPVTPGHSYVFSDTYQSDIGSFVTARFQLSNGSFAYQDLGQPLPSTSPQGFVRTFVAPAQAISLTVFHLIKGVGSLTVDNYSLTTGTTGTPSDPGQFSEGIVSLNFDDGLKEVFHDALPILESAGYRSSQYIVTGRFAFPDYVTQEQVLSMHARGHEIGAHTRTHADLATLPPDQIRAEVIGSRDDLSAIGINPVTFAYPFGSYNPEVVQIVKDAGFAGARTTNNGTASRLDDHFTLRRLGMENTTRIEDVRAAIDQALARKQWLILVFHHIDHSGGRYASTPEFLQQVVSYLQQKSARVVTTAQGLEMMAR